MKFSSKAAASTAIALAALGTAGVAQARSDVYFSVGANVAPGVTLGVSNAPAYYGAPVYYQPAPVYYQPAPVVYTEPVYYAPRVYRPAPVVYVGPRYYGPRHSHYRHGGRHWN